VAGVLAANLVEGAGGTEVALHGVEVHSRDIDTGVVGVLLAELVSKGRGDSGASFLHGAFSLPSGQRCRLAS
jgi:hypothetical protein